MIMNRNIRQTLLAPALLLLAAITLGLAGCTQGEDALQGADGNAGARTLNINVGPKQGFRSGDADSNADTRSTVNESTGAMEWEEGDRIFLAIEGNDPATTMTTYTLVRKATDAWDIYEGYLTTYDAGGALIDLSAHNTISAITLLPGTTLLNAVQAYHTDCPTRLAETGKNKVNILDGGSRDCVEAYETNVSIDAPLSLNLTRDRINNTRLHFPGGLTPGKKYYVDGKTSYKDFDIAPDSWGTGVGMPFTAAADGSLTLCAKIDGTGQTVTLKEKDDDADDTNDKVVYSATFNVAYGSSYRCIISAAGDINPDNRPNLLKPDPIVSSNTVYVVNGYFVTAPDANERKTYQWAASETATEMDSDPCADHGGWRMPTMYDFEKMAGWTDSNPWSQDIQREVSARVSDKDAWDAAFPGSTYWSSVARTSDSNAWIILSLPNGTASYRWTDKSVSLCVRCVQPQ